MKFLIVLFVTLILWNFNTLVNNVIVLNIHDLPPSGEFLFWAFRPQRAKG